jgi:hypothetical protein
MLLGAACLATAAGVDMSQHHHTGVHSSLMHHRGCSGVGTWGLASTHATNTARMYCKTASNVLLADHVLQLLLELTDRNTITVGHTVVSCITAVIQVCALEV